MLKTLYNNSPVWLQNVMVTGAGYVKDRRRYGAGYEAIFREILERDSLDRAALQAYQAQQLERMFQLAGETPYWSRQFAAHGVRRRSDDPFAELEKLPILSKSVARKNAADIRYGGHKERTITHSTSGTTGAGLVFPFTRSAEQRQWATWWRYRSWHGLDRRTWCGYFAQNPVVPRSTDKPPFGRVNRSARQLILSPDHLSAATASAYLDQIKAAKVPWLHGFPSNYSLLATFMLEQNLDPPADLRIVTTGAENLTEQQRSLMQAAFRVPVFEHYGMAEATANISECPEGRLHIDEDYAFVELVPADNQEGLYSVIGTNFTNAAFPLFRYDVGDVVTIADGPCRCGRAGRTVEAIDGRKEDFVVLPSGACIGRLDKIFRDFVSVREAQIYQPSLNKIVLRVVRGRDFSEADQDRLLSRARDRFGKEIQIVVDYPDTLPRGRNGKLRMVVSEVSPGTP